MTRFTSVTHRWPAIVVILTLGASLAGGAPAAAGSDQPAIEGIPWRLTQLAADGELEGLPDGIAPTLLLSSGEASGTAGCNHYSGPATIRGDSLTIGPLLSTQMLCADPAMATETTYLATLAAVSTFELDRDDLRLLDGDGDTLLVYAPTDVPQIAGDWIVTSYQGDDRDLVPALEDTLLTAVLGADGTIEGSSGCNHFSGAYALDGDGIAIGPLASTALACASPELLKQESDLLAAFGASDRWTHDGAELTLSSTSGPGKDTTVVMTAASEPSYIGAWEVTGFDKGNGSIVAPVAGSRLTITFAVDGTVDGSSGCNAFSGPSTVSGWAMTIGPLAGTRVACASPELDTQEQQLLTALQTVTGWSSDGDGIRLLDGTGSIVVTASP